MGSRGAVPHRGPQPPALRFGRARTAELPVAESGSVPAPVPGEERQQSGGAPGSAPPRRAMRGARVREGLRGYPGPGPVFAVTARVRCGARPGRGTGGPLRARHLFRCPPGCGREAAASGCRYPLPSPSDGGGEGIVAPWFDGRRRARRAAHRRRTGPSPPGQHRGSGHAGNDAGLRPRGALRSRPRKVPPGSPGKCRCSGPGTVPARTAPAPAPPVDSFEATLGNRSAAGARGERPGLALRTPTGRPGVPSPGPTPARSSRESTWKNNHGCGGGGCVCIGREEAIVGHTEQRGKTKK